MPGKSVTVADRDVGAWLHRYRLDHELTQADVAQGVNDAATLSCPTNWNQITVSKIEHGRRLVYLHELISLARWTGRTVNALLAEALDGPEL